MSADQPQRMAHLIIRQAMALSDEGIGPMGNQPYDGDTLTEAVALMRHDFNDHELWDHGLLDDVEHPGTGCQRCERRGRS